jgi:AbiJ-like protein
MAITQITRRDLLDAMMAENVNWNGRLEEPEFLSRLFDLQSMPSTDRRFENAAGDIWQHRVNNRDGSDDWSSTIPASTS